METLRVDGARPNLLASWHSLSRPAHPFIWDGLLEVAFDHLQGAMRRDSLVVDIGCGDGHITQVFLEHRCRVLGIDVHLPTLRMLRENYPGVSTVAGDAQQLPLPSESVDAMFSFSTFQYVDRSRALAECSRVLKRGGRFAIIENLADNPVAKAYRAWHRIRGRRYPEHLSPRQHLSWRERKLYESHFSTVNYEALHLFTPLLQASRGTSGSDRVDRAIDRLDRSMVRALPIARAACWHLVVYGAK